MRTLGTLHSPHSLFLLKPFPFIMELFWHCLCFSDITKDDTGISDFRIILYFSHRGSLSWASQLSLKQNFTGPKFQKSSLGGILLVFAITSRLLHTGLLHNKLMTLWAWAVFLVPIQHVQLILEEGWIYMAFCLQYQTREIFPDRYNIHSHSAIRQMRQLLHIKFIQTFTLMLSYPCILISF